MATLDLHGHLVVWCLDTAEPRIKTITAPSNREPANGFGLDWSLSDELAVLETTGLTFRDPETLSVRASLPIPTAECQIAFGGHGGWLAYAGTSLVLIDRQSLRPRWSYVPRAMGPYAPAPMFPLSTALNGPVIAVYEPTGSGKANTGSLLFLHAEDGSVLHRSEPMPCSALEYDRERRGFCVGKRDGTLQYWTEQGVHRGCGVSMTRPVRQIACGRGITAVLSARMGEKSSLSLWPRTLEAQTSPCAIELSSECDWTAVSPDGRWLILPDPPVRRSESQSESVYTVSVWEIVEK
jgi:hypothetical protein